MAFVMGRPSAQEILRRVQDDLNESSGVYAICSPPFIFFKTGFRKKRRGGPILILGFIPRQAYLGQLTHNFGVKISFEPRWLGIKGWQGRRRCQAGSWIMKSGEMGESDMEIYSKGWKIIFVAGVKTRRP